MHYLKRSIEIHAPVEQVFDYITRAENFPGIWPSMVEVRNVLRRDDGSHDFDWTYKMAGVRFRGHATSAIVRRPNYVETRNESGIPSVFRWTLDPVAGGTRLSVEVEYAMPDSVLGRLAEGLVTKINEREQETLLANLKSALEQPMATAASGTRAVASAQTRH